MEYINLGFVLLSIIMAKRNYTINRPLWAMLWSALLGWNLHIVLLDFIE